MSDITLSKAVRSNLLNLQSTAELLGKSQERLSTGLRVNSALDNPTNFFTAQGLNSRANDLSQLLDSVSNAVQTVAAADKGITAITKLVESAQATARQALQTAATTTATAAVNAVATSGNTTGVTITANVTGVTATDTTANLTSFTASAGSGGTTATDTSATLTSFTISDGVAASPAAVAGGSFTAVDFENGGANDGQISFSVEFDNGGTVTPITVDYSDVNGAGVVDEGAVTAQELVDIINDKLNTALSTTGVNYASVNGTSGGIDFTSTTNGASSQVDVTGFAATNGATGSGLADGTDNGTDLVADTSGTVTVNGQAVNLTNGMNSAQIISAFSAAASGSGTGANQFTVTDNGNGTFTMNGSNGNDLVVSGLNTDQASALGLANGTINGTPGTPATAGSFTINGQNVTIGAGDDAADVLLALQGAATASGTGANQFTVADNGDGTFTLNGSNGNDLVVAGLTTDQASAFGLANGTINGTAAVTGTAGSFTINGQSVTLAGGDNAAAILGKLQTAATNSSGTNAFTVTNNAGVLTITGTAGNDVAISGLTAGQTTALGLSNGTTDGTPATNAGPNPKRAELVNTYNDLLGQISDLAKDAGFNGVNLLNGDNLSVLFNEDGSSKLDITGVTNSATGLGLTALGTTAFDTNSSINSTLDDLKGAIDTLRTQSAKFGSNLSVVETRQDFTKNMINVLQTGASNLTLADTNEEAANVLALQTRQQLSSTALSLASQADQNVLRLF